MGAHPKGKVSVSNAPFRERFLSRRDAGEMSLSEMARRLGWMRTLNGRGQAPDATRVARTLGLRLDHSRGVSRYRQTVHRPTAERLAKVLNFDPYEVGL